jgi:hypothetical protein
MLEYDAGWLSGTDADVLQRSAIAEGIRFAWQEFDAKFLKFAPGEEGSDNLPKFVLKTKRYSAIKNGFSRAAAPVVTVTCEQKNIARVRRFMQVLYDQYLMMGFNEFVSTKCNMDQRFNCLNQHINFLSEKLYFYVTGSGLDEANNNMILDEDVTHAEEKSTLRKLLASKGLYVFFFNKLDTVVLANLYANTQRPLKRKLERKPKQSHHGLGLLKRLSWRIITIGQRGSSAQNTN